MAAHYFCQRTPPINPITDYIQHFSYGARGFMRVPVSEANDLNYLLGIQLDSVITTRTTNEIMKHTICA